VLIPFGISVAPLAPDKLFSIGPIPVTNSSILGGITALLVLALFIFARRSSQLRPKSRLAFYIESVVELIFGLVVESFGDKKKAAKHFPLLISLFVFILFWNLSGLLPGIDTITVNVHGAATPVFRSFTTDLNSTLAMAFLSMVTVEFYGVKELGAAGYFRHFFKSWKPIDLFIGLNDVFGELMRLVTLTLRLFGVIYGGEALLTAIRQLAGNFGWAADLPIMLLEIFFCFVQAYLFMMLTTTYIVMATTHEEHQAAVPKQAVPAGGVS
jgi:F-type H+-transporting ATPase subunit a